MFTKIEGQGEELEYVITAAEQCLEGPINESFIQEFIEQEAMEQQKVKQIEPSLRLLK
jgi:hypothetical protein